MVLMLINKPLVVSGKRWEKGDVYFVTEEGMAKVKKALQDKNLSHAVSFFEVNELFDPYIYGSNSEILIIRTGGIGDLIAMSSLASYCWENTIKFITVKDLLPVFNWYETNNVFAKSISEPLYRNFRSVRASHIRKTTQRVYAEGIIEEGGKQNWFEVFFGAIGVKKLHPDFLRPRLRQERITNAPSNIDPSKPSIVINHKASAQMRSMAFEDIYWPLNEILNGADVNIYVHLFNITKEDTYFCEDSNDDRIKVIKDSTVADYLLDLYDASMTISIDTAAVHFREGINKPGIGIYSAFTTDSRVKHYTVTHSFNLKSECDLQPCFIHQQYLDHVCPKAIKGDVIAPCMSDKLNKELYGHLVTGMEDYLRKNLSI